MGKRWRGKFILRCESLESRALPSTVNPEFILHRLIAPTTAPFSNDGIATTVSESAMRVPVGTPPAIIRTAYGINAASENGAGETIAIVVAYDEPNLAADLAAFDRQFGLASPPLFEKVNEFGGSALPSADVKGGWGIEAALDVEWAHAVAPKAGIVLVEANSASTADLYQAVDAARSFAGVSIVSMSWGSPETADDAANDFLFTAPAGHAPVAFVAASGDKGAYANGTSLSVDYPAASPNVLAVGGSNLATNATGGYLAETGWGNGINSGIAGGSGGGTSGSRTIPDVSIDAAPNSGVAVYDSYDSGSATPWLQAGGTSLAAPLWAGVLALADQGRVQNGLPQFNGAGDLLPNIYSLSTGDFHDITTGNNGYAASVGYDMVSGRGSPIVNRLVNDLAKTKPVSIAASGSGSGTSSGGASTIVTPFTFSNWSAIGPAIALVPGTAGQLANVSVVNFGTTVYTGPLNVANTITRIRADGTPIDTDDGSVYDNSNGDLPSGGTWYEFVVATSNGTDHDFTTISSPGPMRLLLNTNGDLYFTGDHYVTFVPVYIPGTLAPVIGSFTDNPTSVTAGTSMTLTASGVTETGGTISTVKFYRETNGTSGLQTASDTLLGTGTQNGTTWTLSTATTGFAAGTYTYYALATDTAANSTTASVTLTVTSSASSGVLLAWDVNGQTNFGTQNLGATSVAAGVTNSLGLTRGSGVTTNPTASSNAWGGNGWSTTTSAAGISGNETISFGLTVGSGEAASLASIDLYYRRSSSGPTDGYWQYEVNGGAWTLIADVANEFSSTTGAAMAELNLSTIAALQNLPAGTVTELRLTPYAASSSSGNWYVYDTTGNDLALNGTVTAVPAVQSLSINGGAVQRSRLTTIAVNFTSPVNTATLTGLGAITLTRTDTTPTGGVIGTVVETGATGANGRITVSPSSGMVSSVTLTFDNADGSGTTAGVEYTSLADGYWQLAIPSLGYTSTAGDPTLHRLFGDINGDSTINAGIDQGAFVNTFGISYDPNNLNNGYNAAFDFNGDGTISAGIDQAAFVNRFGLTLT